MCRRVHRFTSRCCASWHSRGTPGGGLSASYEDRLVEFTFEALAGELPDRIPIVSLLDEREPRPLSSSPSWPSVNRAMARLTLLRMVKHHGVG